MPCTRQKSLGHVQNWHVKFSNFYNVAVFSFGTVFMYGPFYRSVCLLCCHSYIVLMCQKCLFVFFINRCTWLMPERGHVVSFCFLHEPSCLKLDRHCICFLLALSLFVSLNHFVATPKIFENLGHHLSMSMLVRICLHYC